MTNHYHQTGETRADYALNESRKALKIVLDETKSIEDVYKCIPNLKRGFYSMQNVPANARFSNTPDNEYSYVHFLTDCMYQIDNIILKNNLKEPGLKERLETRKIVINRTITCLNSKKEEHDRIKYDTMH